MFDLIIEGGLLVDGSGADPHTADVGIRDGRIAMVGRLAHQGSSRRIQAAGKAVAPGFIDLHTHCGFDPKHSREGANMNYLQQGVTTVVGGNCGFSPVDFGAMISEYRDMRDGLNLGMMIGHNSVRLAILGQEDRAPSAVERRRMETLVGDAMALGAVGFSSGPYYVPGCYSQTDELMALARAAAEHGGFYATHMRSEGNGVADALAEAIAIGLDSGLPVQISHHKVACLPNWGRSVETLAMMEQARGAGLDITVDQYPYTASCSRVGTILPRWVCAGSDEQAQARLQDAAIRARVREEVIARLTVDYGGELERIRIASSVIAPELVGQTFADIAAARGAADLYGDMADFVMELAGTRPASCDTMCIFHSMSEDDLVGIMRWPQTMIASDGWGVAFGEGHPHPRLYGTFPRVLGFYCRDGQVFSLAEAVRRMTSMPATRLGLRDRGILTPGAWADVTIFDPATIADQATFEKPHQYPVGIDMVIVNGIPVLEHGQHTGALPGMLLGRGGGVLSAGSTKPPA